MNWRTVLDSFFSAFNQFRTISFIDIIDILIVAYIIYRIMKLLKDTSAERLIKGIIILVGIMLLASMLHLTMISWLLQQALNVGLFAIVVVFQPELRRLLEQIGKGNFSRLIVPADAPDEVESMITATVSACAGYVAHQDRRAHRVRTPRASGRDHLDGHHGRCRAVRRADQKHLFQEQSAA